MYIMLMLIALNNNFLPQDKVHSVKGCQFYRQQLRSQLSDGWLYDDASAAEWQVVCDKQLNNI